MTVGGGGEEAPTLPSQNTSHQLTMLRASLLIALQVFLTSTVQSPVGGVQGEEGGQQLAGIPGRPGTDYPTLRKVPETTFSCVGRLEGFYADVEARCQVFHVCGLSSGSRPQQSFLCPNGTLFNVHVKTCDWWNNVECTGDALPGVDHPLPSAEATQEHPTPGNIQGTRLPDKNLNNGHYELQKNRVEYEVKINFNRSKYLGDAFNTKVDTRTESDVDLSNTLVDKVSDSTGFRVVVGDEFPQEVGTYKEVTIKPRIKYTHSVTTKIPVRSVTAYIEPTENSLLSKQNKHTKIDSLSSQRPWRFFGRGEDTEFMPDHKETETKSNPHESKPTYKLNKNTNYFDNVSPKILKEYSVTPTGDSYLEKTKPIKVPISNSLHDIRPNNQTQQILKSRNNLAFRESDASSRVHHHVNREKQDLGTVDRKATMDTVINGYRAALDEEALFKKLSGRNELLPLILNENTENPNNLYSKSERYLNETPEQNFRLSLLDALRGSKGDDSYGKEIRNIPNIGPSSSFSNNSFVFDEFRTEEGTPDNTLQTSLKSDFKKGDTNFQNVRSQYNVDSKMLNHEYENEFSITKENFTYEEHTESMRDQFHKSTDQPDATRNTQSSTNSYVSVPYFSSFPELYTSSVSGYYITELPPGTKQLTPNSVKSRTTRLDGERDKLVNAKGNTFEDVSDSVQSETESIYATTSSTPASYEANENVYRNSNAPVNQELLSQSVIEKLPLENQHEPNFENKPILGPEISFENSHVAWPIFPPRSTFYSPYPALKHSKDQGVALDSLSFFPRPPRRNTVRPTNNSEMRFSYAQNDEESNRSTEKDATSPNFDLPQVLQQFLSNSPGQVDKSYQDSRSSTTLIQPTVEVYSESTTSTAFGDAIGSTSSVATSLEMKWTNDWLPYSTPQPVENVSSFDESTYNFRNDDSVVINRKNSSVANGLQNTQPSEIQTPLLSTQSNFTTSQDLSRMKTILDPPDVLSINSLKATPETPTEETFKHSEIVKSLSFDLNSPEDREQFQAAISKGLFRR